MGVFGNKNSMVNQAFRVEDDPSKFFVLCDGTRFRSIVELADAFEHMDDGVFKYHANMYKNDFAAWVRDVFSQEDLAIKLQNATTRDQHQITILRHLVGVRE